MTPAQILQSLSQGFNIVCATCPHLYRNDLEKSNSHSNPKCYVGSRGCTHSFLGDCAGPIFGKDFPLYAGPIPVERMTEICLVCGTPENLKLAVYSNGKHRYSLCQKDRRALELFPSVTTASIPPIVDEFHV